MKFTSSPLTSLENTCHAPSTGGPLNALDAHAERSEVSRTRLLYEALEDARLHSEVRYLGGRLAHFCKLLDPFITENKQNHLHPSLDKSQINILLDHYAKFSAEISLLCSSITSDRTRPTVSSLESMLRTPLEEALLALQSDQSSSYRNPAVVRGWLIDGYRSSRELIINRSKVSLENLLPEIPLSTVWIQESGGVANELSDSEISQMLSLVNTRVVDTSLGEKREGFGRKYSLDEFTRIVRRSTTHLYIPYAGDAPLGIYTIDSTLLNQSAEIQAAVRNKYPTHSSLSQDGWVDIIALAGHARDCVRSPCDSWLIAREQLSDGVVSQALLRPTDSTHVGPGDFIVDASNGLHQIRHNSAFQLKAPSQWEVVTGQGEVFSKEEILLYLKKYPHCESATVQRDPTIPPTFEIESALIPTGVTEVGHGDFVLDRSEQIHQIKMNSATGKLAPKTWSLHTMSGLTLGMFDVRLYLKRNPILKEGLDLLRAPSLYRWLTAAACESALSLGISSLFCQVRIGKSGNTAREKHLAVGWESTGIVFSMGDFQYEILRLDPYRILTGIPYQEVCEILSAHTIFKGEQDHVRTLAKSVWALPPKSIEHGNFISRIQQKFPTGTITSTFDSLQRLQVTVTLDSRSHIYFTQGLPNTDLWRIQEDLLYTYSLYNPLTPLDETLRRYHLTG